MKIPAGNILKLFIAAIFVMVISHVSLTDAQDVDKARDGVVCVYVETIDGESLGFGSGFVIGEDEPFEYIATAWHNINPVYYGIPENHTLLVYIWTSRDDRIPAEVYISLPETGIALLRVDPGHMLYGYEALEIADSETVSVGDEVNTVGFPDEDVEDLVSAYPDDIVISRGAIKEKTTWNDADVYETDAKVTGGNSGSPLLTREGQVVGINNYVMLDNDDINGAVIIDYLTDMLDRRGITYLEAESSAVTEEFLDSEYLLYGGIGAAVLLVVIIIVIVARGRKKKRVEHSQSFNVKKTPVSPVEPKPEKPEAGIEHSNEKPLPVTRAQYPKDKPSSESGSELSAAGASSSPKPVLVGISGYFVGNKIDLDKGQVVIGRDPRLSHLVYPQDNQEISRKHLAVYYDSNTQQFALEDSSSNGTYLSANNRLEPGSTYHLKPGGRFYLGDPKETFEVRME